MGFPGLKSDGTDEGASLYPHAQGSRTSEDGRDARRPRLSPSMGHVTAVPEQHESLEHLLDRADAAMCEQKRMKKLQIT